MFLQFFSVARFDRGNLIQFLNSAHQNYVEMSICNKGAENFFFCWPVLYKQIIDQHSWVHLELIENGKRSTKASSVTHDVEKH